MLNSFFRLVVRLLAAGFLVFGLSGRQVWAASKGQFPGESAKWVHFRSPHFELYSGTSERESRDLLFKLEVLRAIVLERIKLKEKRPLPVTLFYFHTEKTFRGYTPEAYKQNDTFTGYYVAQPDRAVIPMAPTEDDEATQRVIFHEYVHHLMRVTEQNPPTWYNEGTAEIYSTIRLADGKVELGHPSAGQLSVLQREKLMPLDQLFATTHTSAVFTQGKHTGIFYAQSWALLHFCYFGRSEIPREKFDLFVRVARSPKYVDPELMKKICFELLGMDYARLNRELDEYVRSGRYTYGWFPQPAVAASATYAMRPASAQEMHDRLAELEFRINHTARARLDLLQQAERNPADPRPHEALGSQSLMEGDDARAREIWAKAVEFGTENPAVYHELVQLQSRQWFSRVDLYFRLPDDLATHLRDLLHRSIKVAPAQSAAYEILAWVEATAKEPNVANINVVQEHFPELTDKKRSLLALALVRWRKDDLKTATSILDELEKMEPDDWVQYGAETLRAKIEGRTPKRPPPRGTPGPRMQPPLIKPPR